MFLINKFYFHLQGNIYRRGAKRWRKIHIVNGHSFVAKRFSRVCIILEDILFLQIMLCFLLLRENLVGWERYDWLFWKDEIWKLFYIRTKIITRFYFLCSIPFFQLQVHSVQFFSYWIGVMYICTPWIIWLLIKRYIYGIIIWLYFLISAGSLFILLR